MFGDGDSWLAGIGVNVQGLLGTVQAKATAAVAEVKSAGAAVVEQAKGAVNSAAKAAGVAPPLKPAAAPATKPAPPAGAPSTGGSALSLKGSVGAGGKNNPEDVKAVQSALKLTADGNCSPATIEAIKAFQKSIGQAKPDGRVDVGGATSKALAGRGGGAAAPPPAPAPDAAPTPAPAEEGFLDGLKKKVVAKFEEGAGALKDLGGKLGGNAADGPSGLGGNVLNDSGGSGGSSDPIDKILGIGVGGQFSFPGIALPRDPGFPVGTVAFGQFAGKLSVKFKPTLLSAAKAPKAAEAEPGIKTICNEIYENASFKWFGGVTVKGDTKSAGVSASFLKVSTKVGEVTLEFKAFEIGLDIKKIVKASIGGTSANFPAFDRDLNGVKYEIIISLGGALEVSPSPAAILAIGGAASGAILLVIDVALVTGPPLAAAAVIGVGIVMAGEKGKRDALIIEGAIDARGAAQDYAFTMTGSEGNSPGPRAKAAVAAAKAELAKVAASQNKSLDQLMTELRADKNQAADFARIKAQARQQIFAAYFAEVRRHIGRWREEHPVLAAFTTAADDIVAVEKLVAIQFEKS
jgi:hypothetical protein